jgi:hydrogenase maturation protease
LRVLAEVVRFSVVNSARQERGILVIGYGNELRSDDGLGPRVATAVDRWGLPGVTVITPHQLTPELSEPVSQAEAVIFVDASVDAPYRVQVRSLPISEAVPRIAHSLMPSALLTLARDLFGRHPRAWWVTIPASDLSVGEDLSPQAQQAMMEALGAIKELLARLGSGAYLK